MKKKQKPKSKPTGKPVNDRVAEHRQRMKASGYRNVALMLPGDSVAALDKLCKSSGQSRALMLEQLIEQATTPPQKPVTAPLPTVTCNETPEPPAKPPPKAKPKPAKKRRAKSESIPLNLDVLGLARPEKFQDSPGAVSVAESIQDAPRISKSGEQWKEWRDLGSRKMMSARQAHKYLKQFKQDHHEAAVDQRYMDIDKTMIELLATYPDDRPDQRIVLQARNR